MEFYPKRTVEEQTDRLPIEYAESYRHSVLDRIEIDGCEIYGYFEYSFLEEKSYHEQPVRSQDGTIVDLEGYTTFLTPRLIIKYNMMNIGDYRKLMTLLNSKNAFKVTCYDIVADRRVTHEMYFAPPQMPIIYQRYLAALGIKEYTIELIGTNRRIDNTSHVFTINSSNYQAYYLDETWMSFVRRNESDYKVVYSPALQKFIVSSDYGITKVYNGNGDVSPYDIISGDYYTGTVE